MTQTRIKQRFDVLSNWLSNDIVLLNGELAVVDCGEQIRFKVGDGTSKFSELLFTDQNQLCTKYIEAEAVSQGVHAGSKPYGMAAGAYLCADASFSQAFGFNSQTVSTDNYSFTWNGDDTRAIGNYYQSHGKGTFNLNALSGIDGIYIGEQTLGDLLSDATGSKITINDRISSIIEERADLSIVKLNALEYAQLVSTSAIISNCLYVVEDSYRDAFGEQIKNVAAPTDLSDAATKGYVDDRVGSIQIPSDLSSFTNSPGYLVSNDISDYYKKSETSSAAEISNALSAKADLSSIEHVVQYEQDEYGNYTAVTIGSRNPNYDIESRSFVQGYDCAADSTNSHAEGYETIANDSNAHAEGFRTNANGPASHAEGGYTNASGDISHTEGYYTSADGFYTHAEGLYTYASHHASHAEGSYTSALGQASHTEGYGTITDNEGAHAEGGYTSAFGYYSHVEGGWSSTGENAIGAHAEGGFTRADGPISHVEGVKATAEISDYQSFVWQGTDVMPNELTDITPSTWDEYKAHGPGTFNINPVSGAAGVYIGEQSLASMLNGVQSVEWADLTGLVQTSALNPGAKYRITDYVTTIDQTDCSSAMHPFDLIVTAIDHHTLDEHAIATLPSNGDNYFAARSFHVPAYQQYLEYARVPLESWEIKYCLDNDKTRFKFADTTNGKGVIYYMKDEFGNEAPYDFKNVQFKRYKITSSPGASSLEGMYGLAVGSIEVDTSDEMWCYTFNGADYADFGLSEPYDFSGWHVRPTQAVIQQFGSPSVERLQECTGNVIQARQEDADDFSLMSFKLPNNVFHCALTETPVSELPFLKFGYCAGNKFGLNCYNNTFDHNQLFNVFGDLCYSNTFNNDCYSNTFGNNCDSNIFNDNCFCNMFGHSCSGNRFGYNCNGNTFGSDCGNNTFGNNCDENMFSNHCYNNMFGYGCCSNTFSNNCDGNIFGDDCIDNAVSNHCYNNMFGYGCCSNTFGNGCSYIKFASTATSDLNQAKSWYRCITIDSGNQYIVLNCTQSTYDGNEYKNVRILPGVNNSTSYKTITDSNVNQSFCTTYQPANSQVIAV